ncbi:MAG: DUF285 domain-containing protein, partial [Bacteroidales bacterium]|nr:DUF285 domain-containing protein [Bacteroidales bacterium]
MWHKPQKTAETQSFSPLLSNLNQGNNDFQYVPILNTILNSPLEVEPEAYAVFSDGTLTFYYDKNKPAGAYGMRTNKEDQWYDVADKITKVVFDKSFADYRPTSCACWFLNCSNLTIIEGMKEYLNTEKVESMEMMFESCNNLTTLDVSNFNTEKVIGIWHMFRGCSSLTSLDVSNFNTENVTDMGRMFNGCSSLQTIYVGDKWTTKNVTESENMFNGCTLLVGGKGTAYNADFIDATYARIDGGEDTPGYFTKHDNTSFYATFSNGTLSFFYDGDKGKYETTYGLEDNGYGELCPTWWELYRDVTKVVFKESVAQFKPSDCHKWFAYFEYLSEIDGLNYLNTEDVTDMQAMFRDCRNLTTLDLSNFDTRKVTNMGIMFEGCEQLQTIFVGDNWNLQGVTDYLNYLVEHDQTTVDYFKDALGHVFEGCKNLYGGKGTECIDGSIKYARIDTDDAPGYFTKSGETPVLPYRFYALNDGNGTLTFYASQIVPDNALRLTDGGAMWWDVSEDVTKVIFDESVANYRLTSCSKWFKNFENLTKIEGLQYLNTGYVTDMCAMFAGCSGLTSLDVSNFNTEKVTDMCVMFGGCSGLTSLDVSNFNTEGVTNMESMFSGCSNLRTIYVNDKWNINSVESSKGMFDGCTFLYGGKGTEYDENFTNATYARIDGGADAPGYFTKVGEPLPYRFFALRDENGTLTFYYSQTVPVNALILTEGGTYAMWLEIGWNIPNVTKVVFDKSVADYRPTNCEGWFRFDNATEFVGLEYFNTEKVTNMRSMFEGCSSIKKLNLTNFNTEQVTDMSGMFNYCSNLTTIYAGNWSTASVSENNTMFAFCYNLVGGNGTAYNDDFTDATYARIDGGENAPGYFTKPGELSFYVTFSDGTLSFFYDGNKYKYGTTYGLEDNGYGELRPNWGNLYRDVTKVVFDESVANFKPTNLDGWFYDFQNLTEIEGLNYLNTYDITDMHAMFYGCRKLITLDLSSFDTKNVTDMHGMFEGCEMLTTIFVGDNWSTDNLREEQRLFRGCEYLCGGNGTEYSDKIYETTDIDLSYARIDGGTVAPGFLTRSGATPVLPYRFYALNDGNGTLTFYFLQTLTADALVARDGGRYPMWREDSRDFTKVVFDKSVANYRPTYCPNWFCFENVTEFVGLEYFNTEDVTNMENLFGGCRYIKTLDLSSFNTKSVTDMHGMFGGCESLTTIFVGDNWNTDNVREGEDMFYYCYEICGGKGTTYNNDIRGCLYAHIDGGDEDPGYFTKSGEQSVAPVKIYATHTGDILTFYAGESVPDGAYTILRGRECTWLTPDVIENVSKVVFDESVANYRPTSCESWFSGFGSLTEISGLEYLNTIRTTNMAEMFRGCHDLTTLDLSGLNTENVTNMRYMFSWCDKLTTITVGSGWDVSSVTESNAMFDECESLVGGKGTAYNQDFTDVTYAQVDGGGKYAGYLTGDAALVPGRFYAVFEDGTLTFHYDQNEPDNAYELEDNGRRPMWQEVNKQVTKIVFDNSVADFRPTTCRGWFAAFEYLKEISGIEYLNTEKVTDMEVMFGACRSLQTLDLSTFNTKKVTSMNDMFASCDSLVTIFVGDNWSTKAIHERQRIFIGSGYLCGGKGTCYNPDIYDTSDDDLSYARIDGGDDAPGFFTKAGETPVVPYRIYAMRDGNTLTLYAAQSVPEGGYGLRYGIDPLWRKLRASVDKIVIDESVANYKPYYCQEWFGGFETVTEISGLEYLNTEKVTNMRAMFLGCRKLTTLDLSNFNTKNVSLMEGMFQECERLQTIFVGDNWSTASVKEDNRLFLGDGFLCGGEGTEYSEDIYKYADNDISYARIDGGANAPGFFTKSGETPVIPNRIYATLDGDVLTFYSGKTIPSEAYTIRGGREPMWRDVRLDVTKIVFDKSVADCTPNSCREWFEGFENVTEIKGLTYLNTEKVTDMIGMFYECRNLTTLDLSNFNTQKVANMEYMFRECENLKTIYVGDNWTTKNVTESDYMFYACGNLYGGNGTAFDENFINATYARIDGGADTPGYFTDKASVQEDNREAYAVFDNGTLTFYYDKNKDNYKQVYGMRTTIDNEWGAIASDITKVVFDKSFIDYYPTNCAYWFCYCYNLTEIVDMEKYLNTEKISYMYSMFAGCRNLKAIDVSNFNTTKVGSFNCMFSSCSNLSSLDLSSFNTENVTDMVSMFGSCSNLQTIYVGDKWTTSAVTMSESIFNDCFNLYGSKGTHCEESDIQFARIDGGTDTPGYFTRVGEQPWKPVSIDLTTLPNKTEYYINDDLNLEGGELTATFPDNTTKITSLSNAKV